MATTSTTAPDVTVRSRPTCSDCGADAVQRVFVAYEMGTDTSDTRGTAVGGTFTSHGVAPTVHQVNASTKRSSRLAQRLAPPRNHAPRGKHERPTRLCAVVRRVRILLPGRPPPCADPLLRPRVDARHRWGRRRPGRRLRGRLDAGAGRGEGSQGTPQFRGVAAQMDLPQLRARVPVGQEARVRARPLTTARSSSAAL